MAVLGFDGLQALQLSVEQLAAIPPEVKAEMLEAAADVVVEAQQKKLVEYGAVDTGQLRDSMGKDKPKVSATSATITVMPKGGRKRGKTTTTNTEIAYIVENGTKGTPARPFMRDANAEAEGPAVEAAEKKHHNWLDKIGL